MYIILVLPKESTARYATESPSYDMVWFHIKFHDQFRHSSNVKIIVSTISEASVLVLLMEGFMKFAFQIPSAGMIFITNLTEIVPGVQKLLGEIHMQTQTQTHTHTHTHTHTQSKVIL
jgi:hypothetical protein